MEEWQYYLLTVALPVVLGLIVLYLLAIQDANLGVILRKWFCRGPKSLKGKVIWITGASAGIGKALAIECAKAGSKLVLSATRAEVLEEVKKECLAINKNLVDDDVLVMPMDITDTANHNARLDKVVEHHGRLDILVNNAGRYSVALFADIAISVDKQLFDVNVFGVIALTRVAVKYFEANKIKGHVAVTSALVGLIPMATSSVYVASKHAIHGYYDTLRTEVYHKDIAVSIIMPGGTQTDLLTKSFNTKVDEPSSVKTRPELMKYMMTAERCAQLFVVVLANRLDYGILTNQPVLLMIWMYRNIPDFTHWLHKIAMRPSIINKLLTWK